MASSPALLADFSDLTNRAIQTIVKKEADNKPEYTQYYNVRTTTELIEKDSSITGLKEASFTNENAQIVEDVPIQGFDQTYTQESIDLIAPMSYQTRKFAFTPRKLTSFVQMGLATLNRKKDKLSAERLTNGFETSYIHKDGVNGNKTISLLGGDSVEPWSAAHPREDGGTNMNNVIYDGTTYSLPFDYAGVKAAHRTASLMVDGRGNPMAARLDTLVCKFGSSVYFKALEIKKAIENGKIPESNDNDGSGVMTFKIVALEYLTTDEAWGMFDSSKALGNDGEYGFQHIESEANNVDPINVVFKTREIQFGFHTMFTQGYNDVTRVFVWSAGDSVSV